MTFFKLSGINSSSKKNKTASAANTPSQTPRTSVHLTSDDLAAVNKANNQVLTPDAAMDMLFHKSASLGHMQAMAMARM
ncbi:hypothetical protein EDD11_001212 [Mortierella claussenii]|nr:hypothetical protein EDD11_001212 [Mortierella claussenii]